MLDDGSLEISGKLSVSSDPLSRHRAFLLRWIVVRQAVLGLVVLGLVVLGLVVVSLVVVSRGAFLPRGRPLFNQPRVRTLLLFLPLSVADF